MRKKEKSRVTSPISHLFYSVMYKYNTSTLGTNLVIMKFPAIRPRAIKLKNYESKVVLYTTKMIDFNLKFGTHFFVILYERLNK